jgi:hypothetical protein
MLQPSAVASGQVLLAQAAGGAGSEGGEVPFEMLVLEVLLDATAGALSSVLRPHVVGGCWGRNA